MTSLPSFRPHLLKVLSPFLQATDWRTSTCLWGHLRVKSELGGGGGRAHAFNPSTRKAGRGRWSSVSLRAVWCRVGEKGREGRGEEERREEKESDKSQYNSEDIYGSGLVFFSRCMHILLNQL